MTELATKARRITQIIAMPWHAFKEGTQSGAWMLHTDMHALDPFAMVDHFVMADPVFAPHPHAGFSAITYLFADSEGGVINRVSTGLVNTITPGSLHWTQAGSGMVHEEVPEIKDKPTHGLQIFVNSRVKHKLTPPQAFYIDAKNVPVAQLSGATIRVILGELPIDSRYYSARIEAHTKVSILDITLEPHARVSLPISEGHNAIALVIKGAVQIADKQISKENAILLGREGNVIDVQASNEAAQIVLLSGEPLNEPIFSKGPFIGNTHADVTQMILRYQRGEMGQLEPSF
jgi:redox-sensitive bicupin YhaK (pirin superfamily)